MSLVAAGLWTLGTAVDHFATRLINGESSPWLRPEPSDAIAIVSVLASILLFVYARGRDRDPQRILNVGLVYMVLTAFALALVGHGAALGHHENISPRISWIGAVVLMFAAIVPSRPGHTAIAALVAVSMNPVAMLLARARGTWDFPRATDALLMHVPDYLLVGVAVVISHVMTTLGQQVAKARELGSYQLGELLGRGGMGEVYKARHRMLARPAAIKLIRPELIGGDDPDARRVAIQRFRREAEAAANLRSPHTVELYDFGVTDDGTLYFVMELLEGLDLESLVRRYGPMPAGRVVHVLRQACESLEEAHEGGLVHRDIKPANIHLGRLGLTEDFVKVLDFGLVKPIAEMTNPDAEPTLATQAGLVLGTPAYMAPEMARNEKVDGRADIYALGCVAYYLLTGQQVFESATAMQVISKHLEAVPVPPSQRVPSTIPAGLERVVLECLAKDPAVRPQHASELSRRLEEAGIEPWTEAQAKQWWMETARSNGHDIRPAGHDLPTGSDAVTRETPTR
jgi:serine/threonine-protein kinase